MPIVSVGDTSGDVGSGSWTSAAYTLPGIAESVTANFRVKSKRGNGASRWYRRQYRARIDYRNTGLTGWTTGTFSAWADIGDVVDTYVNGSRNFTFPSLGFWDVRLVFEWQDKDGTLFGTVVWPDDYDQTTENLSVAAEATAFVGNYSGYLAGGWYSNIATVSLPESVLNTSWEIWKLDYSVKWFWYDRDWAGFTGDRVLGDHCTKQMTCILNNEQVASLVHYNWYYLVLYGRAVSTYLAPLGTLGSPYSTPTITRTTLPLTYQREVKASANFYVPGVGGYPFIFWYPAPNQPNVEVYSKIKDPSVTIYRRNPKNNGTNQTNNTSFDTYSYVTGGTDIEPTTGHLAFTGYAPTVGKTVFPSTGHLVLTGYTPLIDQGNTIRPASGRITLTGYTPGVSRVVAPESGRLAFVGYVPIVARGGFAAFKLQSLGPPQQGTRIDPILNSLVMGMSQSAIQRSFAGGELNPGVWARTDQTKYQTGLRTCRNFIVQKGGGIANRPGASFVCEVEDSAKDARLIKFVFNDAQTYVIELGDYYMRVIQAGVRLDVAPLGAYNGGTTYAGGDSVTYSGVTYVSLADSNTGHQPDISPTWWHALIDNIFECETPWSHDDVYRFSYVQKDDVIIVVDLDYPVYEIRRYGTYWWSVVPFDISPDIAEPTSLATSGGTAGADTYYKVTAVAKETYEESYAGMEAVKTLTGLAVVSGTTWRGTVAATTGWALGDSVWFTEVVGPDEFSEREFAITGLSGVTFDVVNEETSGGAFTSGKVQLACGKSINTATSGSPITLTWTAADAKNTLEYNVYKAVNGVFGYIGTARGASFVDDGKVPATDSTPPDRRELFSRAGDYPAAVGYYQQRLLFGNTYNDPAVNFASRSSNPRNFSTSNPSQADDAITWRQRGTKNNEIRYYTDVGTLIVFTSVGQWQIQGGTDGVLRPGEINPLSQGTSGISTIAPVVVGDSVVYTQARGSFVRDLKYEITSDGYSGKDLSVYAAHLFQGYTLVRMDYAEVPDSVIWAVRSDGTLLGLTYLREHDIWGWHRHDTQGEVLDVCVVPEGTEDAVYILVRRLINGVYKKYIERFASRQFTDVQRDAIFVDSSRTYDGTNLSALTMTVTSVGGGWTLEDELLVTASAPYFTPGDVDNGVMLLPVAGLKSKIIFGTYVSSTQMRGYAEITVPVEFQAVATTSWAKAVKQVSGFEHLESALISVLGDGEYETAVVSSGTITLSKPYAFVHGGLGYTAEAETLDLDTVQGETIRDKQKIVTSVSVLVQSSGPVMIGPDANNLRESDPTLTPSTGVVTGLLKVVIDGSWGTQGSFVIRQQKPLPLTILAAIPNGVVAMERG